MMYDSKSRGRVDVDSMGQHHLVGAIRKLRRKLRAHQQDVTLEFTESDSDVLGYMEKVALAKGWEVDGAGG